ncbi:SH3 domain-containing protein [Peribacillus sp. SCS-37]|uniref:SH3 domain-containing protein n=1 Tax=Paraperibacillus esterisolvens TaxID=3115296 RepID=UPI0039064AEE
MKNKMMKGILAFILILLVFAPVNQAEAAVKTGVVDVSSGTLNVRSGPGVNYKKVGSLKNTARVTVYSIKSGWAQILYAKKKRYVSDDYLRFYSTMSPAAAKAISDKAYNAQLISKSKSYTKKQIYAILSPQFTQSFIDRYFTQQFRSAGKDSKGNALYHILETDTWGLSLYPLDWQAKYQPEKPTVTHFVKNGKSYLYISQYRISEMERNHTATTCFVKEGNKWLVFDQRVKFDKK